MVATAVDRKSDEQAIRDVVDTWLKASKENDLETMLDLLADDVIFMVVGKEPFGKEAFVEMNKGMKDVQIEGKSEIKEVKVLGDWAWMRSFLTVRFTPPAGTPATASGHILTILRRDADAGWVIARDANLLMPHSDK